MRLLVADDHTMFRAGLVGLLAGQFDVCGEASDGWEAVESHRTLKPDVVILDLFMPRLNGVEAARRIMAHAATPILMLSSTDDRRLVLAALAAGVAGFLLKVDAYQDLVAAVRQVAAGVSFLSKSVRDLASTLEVLTPKEREVLQLLTEGRTAKEAATLTGSSHETVACHRRNILRKLGVRGTAALTRLAAQDDLLNP